MCRPLDPIDFRAREWIPHSGWPIDRDHLMPFYQRAQRLCGLGPFAYEGEDWASPEEPELPLDPARVVTRCFQLAPTRFGTLYRDDVLKAPNVTTFLHANAVEFEANEAARRAERVRVATLDGGQAFFRARRFVLAAGGLENPRLLLASRRAQEVGLGNGHDLVGRFFMEHPHVFGGMLLVADAGTNLALYQRRARGAFETMGCFGFPGALLERERMTNVVTWVTRPEEPQEIERALAPVTREIDAARRNAGGEPATSLFVFDNECEQAPNPESRVSLGPERDALGMPQLRVAWRLSDGDKRSLLKAHAVLAQEIGRAGVGRMRLTMSRDAEWPPWLRGGNHHMGTTRMADDPRHGVVDANCRVHGIENLFVAGSSVFPTGGASNPTLTLVALALRLADQLKESPA
jgi:choline dehydrogenase-like flavoprotein